MITVDKNGAHSLVYPHF